MHSSLLVLSTASDDVFDVSLRFCFIQSLIHLFNGKQELKWRQFYKRVDRKCFMARPTGVGDSIGRVMETHNSINFQKCERKGPVNKLYS